ncbi:hypothetical protein EDEG_03131 [Edhazardia aedis USNM 41457]|uniref:Proteasome subunit beta n=1 Tax=Edhazardia aedis (strain USNM 41457) TaxID=1003232 RepID=J8ZRY0_EDHAE|nr:hypothetical protein EDEG_03131 [Edhazardia aedis USNM 41457]|eukprot:EJW02458.1 hypothetical protein EDEG_03131 [Edhazardia aedis USNM 41457]
MKGLISQSSFIPRSLLSYFLLIWAHCKLKYEQRKQESLKMYENTDKQNEKNNQELCNEMPLGFEELHIPADKLAKEVITDLNLHENITKTGTTIVGLRYKDGVVIAADTRSTSGPIVANKNCLKIHKIYDNIYTCGAGTAADTDRVTKLASRQMTLFHRKYDIVPRINHCVRFLRNHLFYYNGYIGVALVLGGIDEKGSHLYSISHNGYFNKEEFTAMGSGSLAAISILENGYRRDLSREEAVSLACDAVKAGILNDLYSGSNIDVCVLSKDEVQGCHVEMNRNFMVVSAREGNEKLEKYPLNSIKITKEEILKLIENGD